MDQLKHDADEVIALADPVAGQLWSDGCGQSEFDKGSAARKTVNCWSFTFRKSSCPNAANAIARSRRASSSAVLQRYVASTTPLNQTSTRWSIMLGSLSDKGLHGFKRYVGFGVLAYNLHQIGRRLLERRPQPKPVKMLCE